MTSIEPPLAVIAASADFENLAALTVNFLVNSPLPRTLTPDFFSTNDSSFFKNCWSYFLNHLQRRSIDQGLQVRIL